MAPVYALLADGTTVEIRPAGPGDFDAVKAMHQAMSPNSSYLRFFNISRLAADTEARRICRDPAPGQMALLAISDGEVVGSASSTSPDAQGQAEVAFAVADHMHHRGIATLLLEHLVSYARSHQITTFTAETLTENQAMLNVFADAGLPVERHYADGIFELTFPLPGEDAGLTLDSYLNAVADRESRAEVASLRHVLAPESVAVIGASRRRGTVGRAIVDNIRVGGYAGRLYTVNPRARQIGGERCLSSALDLPEAVDLAVIAVPAAGVLDVAERCGQRGVRSLVVITAGLEVAARADLLAVCRRHGMRLVGPDCFGVAVPGIGLDATFAARPAKPGVTGLVMQSGGLGFAMVDHLSRIGVGISSFASVGDKLDVSGNDMLMWWEHDGLTKLAVLYLESFGNPRKFARTARRVSGAMPVLTVLADRSDQREALFEQAGVVTTRGFGELSGRRAAGQPARPGRTHRRDRVQRRQRRPAGGGRLHRPRAVGAPPGRPDQAAAAVARTRPAGHRPGRHDGPGFGRGFPPMPGVARRGRGRARHRGDRAAHRSHRRPGGRDPGGGQPRGNERRPARRRRADPTGIRAAAPGPDTGLRLTGGRGAGAGPCGRLQRLAGRTARPRARLHRRQDLRSPSAGPRVPPAGPGLAPPEQTTELLSCYRIPLAGLPRRAPK